MAQGQFQLSDTNPNDSTGGGGCICDEVRQTDCRPPFVVLYGNTMDSPVSPHVVVCARCIGELSVLVQHGESAALGNPLDAQTVRPENLTQPFPELRDDWVTCELTPEPKRLSEVKQVVVSRKKGDESGKPAI